MLKIKQFGESNEYYISRKKGYVGVVGYDSHEYLHKDFVWRKDTIHPNHPFEPFGPNVYYAYFNTQQEAEEFLDGYIRSLEAGLRPAEGREEHSVRRT